MKSGRCTCNLIHREEENVSMITARLPNVGADVEAEWLAAVVQVEHARQHYAQYLRAADKEESEVERLWLYLWLAERRRDELFRRLA
jgi:hypothetical protein